MPLFNKILNLLRMIGPSGHLQIVSDGHEILSDNFRREIELYIGRISEERKNVFENQLGQIEKKMQSIDVSQGSRRDEKEVMELELEVSKLFGQMRDDLKGAMASEYKVSPARRISCDGHLLPQQLQMKDKILTSYGKKTQGGSIGGFYFDQEGKKYIVKFPEFFSEQTPATPQKVHDAALESYYEVFLNKLSREILGETYSSRETEIGYYAGAAQGERHACFVSALVPGYRDVAQLSEEEKKSTRPKFHSSYAFNCFVGNSDIYDENLGVDAEENPVNIDLGLKPPFLFPEQIANQHNGIVDQLANFISHQNYFGGQKFRRQYFGYDEHLEPLAKGADEKDKANDISYYLVLEGVKKILLKRDAIVQINDQIIAEIYNDESIDKEIRKKLADDFLVIENAFIARMKYLQDHFGADLARLDEAQDEFRKIKWRHHPKYQKILDQSRHYEREMAGEAGVKNLALIAEILEIAPQDDMRMLRQKILTFDMTQISEAQKSQLQEAAKNNFTLPIMVMNADLPMVQWLLKNDIGDVRETYRQRNHNPQFRPETPLAIAIGIHNDKLLYDHDKAAMKGIIDELQKKFFDESKISGVTKPEFTSDLRNKWPLRMTKMVYEQYRQDQEVLENKAATVIQNVIRRRDAQKLASTKAAEIVQ